MTARRQEASGKSKEAGQRASAQSRAGSPAAVSARPGVRTGEENDNGAATEELSPVLPEAMVVLATHQRRRRRKQIAEGKQTQKRSRAGAGDSAQLVDCFLSKPEALGFHFQYHVN